MLDYFRYRYIHLSIQNNFFGTRAAKNSALYIIGIQFFFCWSYLSFHYSLLVDKDHLPQLKMSLRRGGCCCGCWQCVFIRIVCRHTHKKQECCKNKQTKKTTTVVPCLPKTRNCCCSSWVFLKTNNQLTMNNEKE